MMRWPGKRPQSRDTGSAAEAKAEAHLKQQGLLCLERNFQVRGGEIDLVMQDGEHVVFVEVRFRNDDRHGSPLETVTAHKQARIRHAASHYLQQHPQLQSRPCRFDVVGLLAAPMGHRVTIEWVKDAFS